MRSGKKEARAKPRNVDDSGRNRTLKCKEKGLGETQRTTKDKWYGPKSRVDWKPVALAPCPKTPQTSDDLPTVFSKGPCSVFIFLTLKNGDSFMIPGKKRKLLKESCVLKHNLELECYQEVRWLKNSALPPLSGS